ncbi:hypothetical protein BGZ54_001043 [Gamsiella multidivaricata]|nr:hypothetical protein BGZ54_001043 [Gamsiella multidivaricata]
MGPLRGTDYIGQFERERAQARYDGAFRFREGGMPSLSTASLAMAVCHGTPSSSMSALQRKAGVKSVDTLDRWRGSGNEEKGLREAREQHQLEPCGLMSRLTSSNLFGLEFLRRHGRQSSSQSDISEKLMHLPEPSRFEGVCSCRGVVNITSMLLIMCGLVLLVLGYPIATSLKKQRLAEEEANGMRAEMGQVKFTMANSTLMSGGEGGSVGGAMTTATAYVEGV